MNGNFKIELDFEDNKRAAVLIMYKSKYKTLPNDERIARILSTRPDTLKGKAIVTQTISCAAYMMYLSDTSKSMSWRTSVLFTLGVGKEKIAVTLSTDAHGVPTIDAGGANIKWSSEGCSGIIRSGGDPNGTYVPLCTLRRPPPTFWDRIFGRRGEMKDNDMIEQ